MIEGIGIDIVEIKEIRQALKRWGKNFLKKVFTQREVKYCSSKRFEAVHYAGRFAAKEALAKALGTGFWRGGLKWTDLEIVNSESGRAEIRVKGKNTKRFSGKKILISISHSGEYAVANAIIYRER